MKLRKPKSAAPSGPKASKGLLFCYGDLIDGTKPVQDVALGVMKIRENPEGIDAAAKFGGREPIFGQCRPVSADTIAFLDKVEAPIYKRVQIDTSAGEAWAYESTAPLDEFNSWNNVPGANWSKYLDQRGAVESGARQLAGGEA
jgi:gamma-glutamylcyclotransferase (GGCT)/AIG2-like uncharacterized protein YtfP